MVPIPKKFISIASRPLDDVNGIDAHISPPFDHSNINTGVYNSIIGRSNVDDTSCIAEDSWIPINGLDVFNDSLSGEAMVRNKIPVMMRCNPVIAETDSDIYIIERIGR